MCALLGARRSFKRIGGFGHRFRAKWVKDELAHPEMFEDFYLKAEA